MGNRAHVIFTNKDESEISPAVYLHWNGGPESIYAFLAEVDRRGVRPDQNYEVARFCQIVVDFMDQHTIDGLSLGVTNGPKKLTTKELENFNHGDNGVFIVCREEKPTRVKRYTGRFLSEKEVATEYRMAMQHSYNVGEESILAKFAKLTEGKTIEAR